MARLLALKDEFEGFDEAIQKITRPDPSNPSGPQSIIAAGMPIGYWYMLRARILNLLESFDQVNTKVQAHAWEIAEAATSLETWLSSDQSDLMNRQQVEDYRAELRQALIRAGRLGK